MTENDPAEDNHEIVPSDRDLDIEAPDADAAEQRAEVVESAEDAEPGFGDSMEVDPADVAEQRRVVQLDDDEYR